MKYQQHKLPKLPRIVQKIQWIKDKLNTTKDSKLDTFLKPINKEEFKKFISLYKKE